MRLKLRRRLSKVLVRTLDLAAIRRVHVIGDSHVRVFFRPIWKLYFPVTRFDVCRVSGATASGLTNPNSQTNAYGTFREKLRSVGRDERLLLLLGEVDTGFVIWYRAEKYGTGVEAMLDRAVDAYTGFIDEARVVRNLAVISTPLPTIRDGTRWGEVAKKRSQIETTQRERTALTLEFNRRVGAFCRERDVTHLDLDAASLGEDGFVRGSLLNPDPRDHHYEPTAYARLLRRPLEEWLAGGSADPGPEPTATVTTNAWPRVTGR
jgi:hypothetical protein